MAWVESTCRTVRCLKKAMKVAIALPVIAHLVRNAATVKTAVIVVHEAAVVTVVAVAETGVDVVAIEVAAGETAVAGVETVTTVVEIEAQGVNAVTSMMTTEASGQNDRIGTVKAAEIVAQGVQPVAMMEAVVDLARRVDAKLLANSETLKTRCHRKLQLQ